MELAELRKKMSDWDFSEQAHTVETFTSDKGNTVRIDHLRKGNSHYGYVRFVNDDYELSVYGDFGNWIFNRPFIPSKGGFVSVGYWNEKLHHSSSQDHAKYNGDETAKEIQELINSGLEEYGYEGEELEKLKEWYTDLLMYTDDELDYTYNAYRGYDSPVDDMDCIPLVKDGSYQLLIIFDAFNEICSRMK